MFLKKAIFGVILLLYPFYNHARIIELPDDAGAYQAGEIVAKFTVQAWIAFIKQEKEILANLIEKMMCVSEDYVSPPQRSFLLGYASSLDTIDIEMCANIAGFDLYRYALVHTVYYYWLAQLFYALESHDYTFEYAPHEKFLNNALQAAMMISYGEMVPEVMQKIRDTVMGASIHFVDPFKHDFEW